MGVNYLEKPRVHHMKQNLSLVIIVQPNVRDIEWGASSDNGSVGDRGSTK